MSGALVVRGAGARDPVALARQVIAAQSKSFALASRLLPAASRDAAVVLYAWCRRADDAIDDAAAADRPAALARLRAELDDVYASAAGAGAALADPTLAGLAQVVRTTGIPRLYPDELLAGMAMDVAGVRYTTRDELLLYAYRVAGVVGLMMCHVMGLSDAAARRRAVHLGMAMQLTNIARDVADDWRLGRLYLPATWLAAAGAGDLPARLAAGAPLPPEARAPLAAVVRRLLAEAEELYRSGDQGVAALPWRAGLAIRTARSVYAAIGDVLARRGHDVFAGRAVVSRGRKLWLAARAVARGLAAAPRRLLRPFRPVPLPGLVRYPDDVLPG